MAPTPANMYADVLRHDLCAFIHRSFLELNAQTPRRIHRKTGEILQPARLSPTGLEAQRRGMTEYNFVAQYQQDPQPPTGIIVKREWLKSYEPGDLPKQFDQIFQSWDTANKDTELSNFSVCTTWGLKDRRLFLLDVYRHKLDFPALKRAVRELAALHRAKIVLIEDKASGSSLSQELRAEHFSLVQAAPAMDGDKVMRLRAQTAKIEEGFVLFPKQAHWLEAYIRELISFPNSKYDDQVDSTVFALAWVTLNPPYLGWTDQSIDNYVKLLDSLCQYAMFGRLAGRPW